MNQTFCITSYTEVIQASEHLLRGMKRLSKLFIQRKYRFYSIFNPKMRIKLSLLYKWLFNKENSLYLEKTSGFILSFIEININFAANFKPYCTSSV